MSCACYGSYFDNDSRAIVVSICDYYLLSSLGPVARMARSVCEA